MICNCFWEKMSGWYSYLLIVLLFIYTPQALTSGPVFISIRFKWQGHSLLLNVSGRVGIILRKVCATNRLRLYLQLKGCKYKLLMRRDVFQAIADPTRRAILSLIAIQAMTPNAVAEHFGSSRQAVSKHIKILTECQLLKPEQSGREMYYHFNPDKMKELDSWLGSFRASWENRFCQLDNVLENLKTKNHENTNK